ncbi:hypothetical protein OIE62_08645 [Streptomyces scopuliridis]|uniref:Uncharacterized protein n=1 Tax=Streptomyces scopuliridis TaxID=452529 RepID=A0ACD4ZSF0_9ACTN|nr:hypothetical protein [Streptomyces scopuliridis]WSB36981.1 hypothetical protein OG949_31855 [Streptomyces scopuliridis]WSC01376.1 hypothetical protein OG835_33175 [Streptomyces scopuliridis]WSC05087.1 hypothetical protein OIE62_08645 [Streptomyces scopuliridis]
MRERQEASEDAVMTRIGQAVMLLHGGDREEARNRFGELWAELGEAGDAFHRCALAHYMADTQDDPGDELAWDLRALTAADGLGEESAAERGVGGGRADGGEPGGGRWAEARESVPGASSVVRAFYPSLHLNLAADYLKLQRPEAARLHLDRARDAADALGAEGDVNGVRAGIDRLERLLRER